MKIPIAASLSFVMPLALTPRYEASGYVPPLAGKHDAWLVSLPATYLLNGEGMIVLAFIDVLPQAL